jgi:hypothetical protein
MNATPRLIFSLVSSPEFFRVQDAKPGWEQSVPSTAEALSLERTKVNDEDLKALAKYRQLRCLDLDATNVTDKSLALIASLPNLEELWLEETAVTDFGLRLLQTAKELRFLSVAYSAVTSSGVESLRAACPALTVSA